MNEAMQVFVSTTTKTVAASAGQEGAAQRQSRTLTRFWSLAYPFPLTIARQAVVTLVSQLRLRDVKATYSPTRLCAKISAGNISSAAVSEPIDGSSGVSTN